MRLALILSFAALAAVSPAGAQQHVRPGPDMSEPVIPAQVQPDSRISFAIRAPTATSVQLSLPNHDPDTYPMARLADGVWTTTVGPFAPEVYDYSFVIGGAPVNASEIEVPGNPPRVDQVQNVPRGTITIQPYRSTVQNTRNRQLYVYLPPQYYSEPGRRFPVLYLFAGMYEDDWTHGGRANVILDNEIAEGRAAPMIVVMPNNTVGPRPVPALQNAAVIEREMTTDIIPFIDRSYRTLPDRDHRAIAGVSFGGGTAFTVGVRHLETFGSVAEFATGTFGGASSTAYAPGYVAYSPDNITPNLYAKLKDPATRPRLFYMTVGTEDPRAPFQRKALADFQAHGIKPVFKTFPGTHEWRVFKPSLAELLPLLFR